MAKAQTQIENGGFENWENVGTDTEEPTDWSSLKTADDNSIFNLANQAPQVIWRDGSNPYAGNYCLYQKVAPTNILVGLAPNSITTNGRIFSAINTDDAYAFTDASDNKWRTVFNNRPDSLIGWYKCAPQNNDKGAIDVLLHTSSNLGRLPDNGTTNHHIGTGNIEFPQAVSTWTRFSFPINYTSSSNPNYVLIVTSAGDKLNAQPGSELWLDELSFVYNPAVTGLTESSPIFTFLRTNNAFHFSTENINQQASISIFSLDGKAVINHFELSHHTTIDNLLPKGIYIYKITIDGHTTTDKFVNL